MNQFPCLIVAAVGCAVMGCSAMNDSHGMAKSTVPTPAVQADPEEGESRVDHEQEEMMLRARKGLSPSKEPGSWFDRFRDPQALSTERSLGVEHY